ncbi:HEAT repeat domain-containing protein [Kitasatospora sp. NPDC048239]|uniref:HEAT repeat domain-containing protein n=1 Tax=Kitasatospora sp. NPDC048239 TaxID=3364046 RepID=UPI003716B009
MGTGEQHTGVEASGDGSVALGGSAATVVTGNGNLFIGTAYLGTDPERPREPDDTAAVDAYRQRVRESYARLDLEVLTPLSEQGEHPVVELREVFVAPRVRADPPPVELPRELLQRLLATGEVLADRDLPPGITPETVQRLRDTYRRRPAEAVLDVLAGPRGARAVFLGDPGAGKSTLARYLALTLTRPGCATGPLAALAGHLPLVVELRQYAEAQWRERTFEDFLDHLHATKGMSVPAPVLRHLLRIGAAVVVFDGLDELFDPRIRTEAAERIAAFAARWDQARVVVTSRVIGYQRGVLDGAGFAHFMLEDLDEEQIHAFASSWYRVACPGDADQAEQLVRRVTDAVAASRPVRELAGNPLLLTILAIIGRRQTLPRDRQGVYEHAVKVLVAHWDRDTKHLKAELPPAVDEALEMLEPKERLELLRLLARRMQDGHGGIAGNHIHADELEEVVRDYLLQFGHAEKDARMAARAMREQLRTRNFILARYGGEVYGFVHRAFLEYLAAADIAHRYKEEREWTPEELIEEVVAARVGDPAWHEVLLLLVGQLSEKDAARVIDRLLAIDAAETRGSEVLVLAIRALAEVRKIGLLSAQSDAVVDAVTTHMMFRPMSSLTDALPALAGFGSAWSGRRRYLRWFHLIGQFHADEDVVEVACAMYGSPELVYALAVQHDDRDVRCLALGALGQQFPESHDVLRMLSERAVDDPEVEPRSVALRLLGGARWRKRDGVLELLLDRAVNDPDSDVRITALEALSGWLEQEEVFQVFLERAVEDPSPWPRAAALEALRACNWRDREDVVALVMERAVHDPGRDARTAALGVLGAWGEREDFLHLLRERAVRDPDSRPRVRALRALRTWQMREDVLAFAIERAVHDPDPGVRVVAVAIWGEQEEFLVTLMDRAVRDPDAGTRIQAVIALRRWADRERVLAVLLDRLVNDPDAQVRSAALSQVGAGMAPEDARRVMVDRGLHDSDPFTRASALDLLCEWADREEVHRFLLDRAVKDPDPEPRSTVLRNLGQDVGPDREDVRALILDRAVHDPHPGPRTEALQVLSSWVDREQLIRVLTERAVRDPDSGPRAAALDVLAEARWGRREELADVFLDRARHDPSPRINLPSFQLWVQVAADEGVPAVLPWAAPGSDTAIRVDAVRMLAWEWPDDRRAVEAIRALAGQDEDPEVRAAASHALVVVEALTRA